MPIPVNVPTTVWSGRGGEYASNGPFLLADAAGVLLADASAINLINSGIKFVPLEPTVWTKDDSK